MSDTRVVTAPKWMTMMVISTVIAQALVGILLIVTYANAGKTANKLATYQECVAEYNQTFSTAYEARADAATEVSEVMDSVIKAVNRKDAELFGDSVDRYLQVRRAQDRERRAHPTPPLPSKFCGPVPGEE